MSDFLDGKVEARERGFHVDARNGIRYWTGVSWVQMVPVDGFWHTATCLESRAAAEAWKQAWPNHCTTCDGQGVKTYYENQAPLGSGQQWLEQLTEPCEDCTAADAPHCPRCGKPAPAAWDDGDMTPCLECGWQWGEDAGDYLPSYECGCYWYTDLEGWKDAVLLWQALFPAAAKEMREKKREWTEKQNAAGAELRRRLLRGLDVKEEGYE